MPPGAARLSVIIPLKRERALIVRSAENMKTTIIIFIMTMTFAYLGYRWGRYTERTGLAIGFSAGAPSQHPSESIRTSQNTLIHECTFVPGWDIVKENDGRWLLQHYSARDIRDPQYKPLPSTIDDIRLWKSIGYWNTESDSKMVIKACPWCGKILK